MLMLFVWTTYFDIILNWRTGNACNVLCLGYLIPINVKQITFCTYLDKIIIKVDIVLIIKCYKQCKMILSQQVYYYLSARMLMAHIVVNIMTPWQLVLSRNYKINDYH